MCPWSDLSAAVSINIETPRTLQLFHSYTQYGGSYLNEQDLEQEVFESAYVLLRNWDIVISLYRIMRYNSSWKTSNEEHRIIFSYFHNDGVLWNQLLAVVEKCLRRFCCVHFTYYNLYMHAHNNWFRLGQLVFRSWTYYSMSSRSLLIKPSDTSNPVLGHILSHATLHFSFTYENWPRENESYFTQHATEPTTNRMWSNISWHKLTSSVSRIDPMCAQTCFQVDQSNPFHLLHRD